MAYAANPGYSRGAPVAEARKAAAALQAARVQLTVERKDPALLKARDGMRTWTCRTTLRPLLMRCVGMQVGARQHEQQTPLYTHMCHVRY